MNGSPITHIDLMSGIGGFAAAARLVWGDRYVNLAHSEIDKFACQNVYHHHFPESECIGDVRQAEFDVYNGQTYLVTAGVPCPGYSVAGVRRGNNDERYLWDGLFRCLRATTPRWFVAENVRGIITTNGGTDYENIIVEMESIGYEVFPLILPSDTFGSHHIRERVWFVGRYFMDTDTHTARRELGEILHARKKKEPRNRFVILRNPFEFSWYARLSRIHGIRNGLSRKLDASRNRVLGNAIVPQVAAAVFTAIQKVDTEIFDGE